jgi:hypothetical protein
MKVVECQANREQVRGFAPIGMLESWNIGVMGSGIMEWWV